ncbi:MAG: hypothetical protein ABIR98_03675 [Usitatibacter sp.]
MMYRVLACLAVALGLGAQAANVAFVADIRGNATIEGDGKLNFLAELAPGTRLLLGSGTIAAITFAASGSEFTIAGPGEYLVTPADVKMEKGAAPVKRAVITLPDPGVITRVSQAATASVRMRSVTVPAPASAVLEYPVDARVATLRPVLRWKGDMSTDGVIVRVQDSAGKEVWKARMQPNTVSASLRLSPATRYTWTLMTPKGAVAEAQFETLPADAVARAEKSRAGARSFSDRVLHAFLLLDLGAQQDAREAWAALSRERPDLPELAALAR